MSTKLFPLLIAAGLALTACGGQASDVPQDQPVAEETAPAPEETADPDRADFDPTSIKISKCEIKKNDYGSAGIDYSAEFEGEGTNTTKLTGVMSVHVQYQDATGKAIAEGLPGANDIKPGQAAKLSDTTAIELKDFPGKKIKCVVTDAEVYLVKQ
ncbi:hypothetical protein [Streptosporangium sandarakinum]|uniref:hypothetical protein n=1 Tax=Streptosporangium sandarakinum TaxID=1260955 RepID=UPI0037A9FE6B